MQSKTKTNRTANSAKPRANAVQPVCENVAAFHADYRRRVRRLSAFAPEIADLTHTFPGLIFALVTEYGSPDARDKALEQVEDGASLRAVAKTLGLPYWLRKLPAQSFRQPVPDLPATDTFARKIANLIPSADGAIAPWLERVGEAYAAVNADYALWVARQSRFPSDTERCDTRDLLAAWAWYSRQPESFGHALLRGKWVPGISFKRALDEARVWARRADMAVTLGQGIRDTWFEGGRSGDFEFVPLVTATDFLNESGSLANCLDQYAEPINSGHVRVFSIRQNGKAVGCLEIGPHDDDCLMPTIEQLRGPRNNRAGPEVWRAAYAWLGGQTFRTFPGPSHGTRSQVEKTWRKLWDPLLLDVADRKLNARLRTFARRAHGFAGVRREAERVLIDI